MTTSDDRKSFINTTDTLSVAYAVVSRGAEDPVGPSVHRMNRSRTGNQSVRFSWNYCYTLTAVTVLLLSVIICDASERKQVTLPPRITQHPPYEIAFKEGEAISLPCVGISDPKPIYKWKKDDKDLNIGLDYRMLTGAGTLVIEEPRSSHEGVYQCFASNSFGVAISVRSVLKRAVQDPFPTVKEARIHRPQVGTHLTLNCQPPHSYPSGLVYWGENSLNAKLKPLENTERISLDYDGNLHFSNIELEDSRGRPNAYPVYTCVSLNEIKRTLAQGDDQKIIPFQIRGKLRFSNILLEDSRGGLSYVCIHQNMELRSLVQGDDQRILPDAKDKPRLAAPQLMWSSPTVDVALKGQAKKMKCIFSGYPTPSVTWIRVGAAMPEKAHINSFGQELIIMDVDMADAGTYQCISNNSASSSPIRITVTLSVESPPFWTTQPPEDVNTSEEESAQFDCRASGYPRPTISWLINGVPLSEIPANRRRIEGKDYIRYENVTKTDAVVIQCNASNKHGYIFANSFLNVLAEAPTFIETPGAPTGVVKVAVDQSVTLTCQVFGAPKPTITWKKEVNKDRKGTEEKRYQAAEPVSGSRFVKENNGNLKITNVMKHDEGTYFCVASNKFGEDDASGELIVRQKTQIFESPPASMLVNASSDVVLRCSATTDPALKNDLKIEWLKNGEKIDYVAEPSLSKVMLNNSLIITSAQVSDTATYTCRASNGLDSQSVNTQFTVRGPPDPPYDVRLVSCTSVAEVMWSPGSENNDPVTEYIVYYNTSHDPPQHQEGTRSLKNRGDNKAKVKLLPWTNYTFHVKAVNSLGMSASSNFTPGFCTTQPKKPYRHPANVCSRSGEPGTLIITWEPIPPFEHNGERFHYLVGYKRRTDPPELAETTVNVTNWKDKELIVRNQKIYEEYNIYVQAVNAEGAGPPSSVDWRIGFSSQSSPLDQPQNFHINMDTMNSTGAEFLWEPVDESPERVRGYFIGYEIQFWKSDEPTVVRKELVPRRSWDACPKRSAPKRSTRAVGSQLVRAHTNNLWPYSSITAGVLVLNAGSQKGQLSNTFEFKTPEGVPGAVSQFEVTERGSHHFKLHWNMPAEHNGILTGYVIKYMKAPPEMSTTLVSRVENPFIFHRKLHNLTADTQYNIYIYATTTTGEGKEYFLDDRTLVLSAPAMPVFGDVTTGENFVNVSWLPPSRKEIGRNPGSKFRLKYKKADWDEWRETGHEEEHNWMNLPDMENGAAYDLKIVAVNNGKEETESELRRVIVGQNEAPLEQNIAGTGWFIGLMCAIAFLLLILLLLCLIKRNRGGKYAVHEKEKLRGHDSTREDDEAGFGEYTRAPNMELKYSDDPEMRKSKTSLDSEEKPLDSETDSLGEYEDPDPSKFNEDGSFIGQYGGKKKGNGRLNHDTSTPTALSTFV